VRTDPANPNIIITEQVIPADVGGKWIREIALYDADGDMVAVANCAPSFKPLLVQGTGKTQIIRMNFIVANTASVVLKIDPAIVLATREYVDLKVAEEIGKLDLKQSVVVATLSSIALGGLQTIDGIALGNPNIPQKVIVTNMPVGGSGGMGMGDLDDAGGKDGKGKGKGGRRGGRSPGRGIGAGMKGPAVLAVIEAGFKVKDTYDNAETQDEKAEGYGAAAGGLAGTLAGAAAGAAIGSAVPVIGTILGGLIGGYLGSLGGDALGGAIGKSMYGSDESKKVMPVAGPLMMKDAGKDIPPVLGDIAKSFSPSRTGPLMLANPGQGALPATPGAVNPGDAARSMMMPQASTDAVAAPLAAAVVAKVQPAKIEPKVDIHAPITLTVQGDVKDPAELMAQLRPLIEQQQREIAQQLENRKLYDAPHT